MKGQACSTPRLQATLQVLDASWVAMLIQLPDQAAGFDIIVSDQDQIALGKFGADQSPCR